MSAWAVLPTYWRGLRPLFTVLDALARCADAFGAALWGEVRCMGRGWGDWRHFVRAMGGWLAPMITLERG